MTCGVGRRHGSDLVLLWLWRRPAAIAPIQPLGWQLSYAAGAALKSKKNKQTNKKKCPLLVEFPRRSREIRKKKKDFGIQ